MAWFWCMQDIISRENKIFKSALKLQKKKYRDEEGLYLIEGENLLEEAIKCHMEIKTIFYKNGYDGLRFSIDNSFNLSDSLFNELSDTETSQGVIAVVKKKKYELNDFLDFEGANFLVVDRVQDPGNLGTMIRTSDAAGYSLVILIKGTCDPYQSKVIRSTAGSIFRVPIVILNDYDSLISFLKNAKKKLVSTTLDSNLYYYDLDLTKDIALVIGNEGNGIDRELIEKSDLKIKIPMTGNIESLNCAVSCGILLYERVRKCKKD